MTSTRPAPRFDAPAGTVLGRWDDGVVRATGIRYARAERFRPPVPEPPADGVVDATAWSPACPQPPAPELELMVTDPMGELVADEDCLRLSVTVPEGCVPGSGSHTDRLPVMVWVHGGSYVSGAGDAPAYDPAVLVREQRVVVVSVTYRLGLLGFLGVPGDGGRPANLGLLDLVAALRWVRANVAAFGGDPDAVTLFGESAGGDAIAHLMAADGARGLFRRAVVSSAPLGLSRGRARMSAAMAAAARTLDAAAPVADVVGAQARVAARARRYGLAGAMPFGTQYGFAPLPAEDALAAAWAERAPEVDLLVGTNSREVALFVALLPPAARLARLPGTRRAVEALVRGLSRRIYARDAVGLARRHRAAGGRAASYVLSFGAGALTGAHAVDLPLLFPHRRSWEHSPLLAGIPWDDVVAAGREVRRVWAHFARTGAVPADLPPFLTVDRG
ncbi:carboxylesterase family protein [Geodermatophilus nigrescens]|uniref:Carboxylic ester hydrolase n=1 Tax=Geodermatophilus nigrescens TaxID=1070870 RepID=A0A1M5ILT5_9ACTN|nr:carboxylesterase family protein [Geodermatophilus nigrescens]SHG29247.1 para-nitrobenzyl esterase [Geodermatophilus nigrescens]